MPRSKSYQESLIESLKDPTEAAAYLNAALEDGEPEVFLLALRDVVNCFGGIGKLAATTSLNRENLYRMLSTKGNPEFFSLSTVLNAIGFRLAVEPTPSRKRRGVSKLVLRTVMTQVNEPASKYARTTNSKTRSTSITVTTRDDKEVGMLEFDGKLGALILRITGDLLQTTVQEAEIQTRDGRVYSGRVSVRRKDELILLTKTRVSAKDVEQITLTSGNR